MFKLNWVADPNKIKLNKPNLELNINIVDMNKYNNISNVAVNSNNKNYNNDTRHFT